MTQSTQAHTTLIRALAAQALDRPDDLYDLLLRTRSRGGRDVLAHLAVPGARAVQLEDVGRALDAGMSVESLSELAVDARFLGDLAKTCALQVTRDTPDLAAARGLWAWQVSLDGVAALKPSQRDVWAQVLWEEDSQRSLTQLDQLMAEEVLSAAVQRELVADRANPFRADLHAGSTSQWEDALTQILGGLARVRVSAGGASPFDRLTVDPLEPVKSHGRVAVLMSAYRPDHSLLTAVRSIVRQTWQDWELVIVDDASPPGYAEVFEEAHALDPRVRVIHKAVNGGTYRCRNTALATIDADYFTFADSDDWSHPQRLERTVRPLVEDPRLVATMSRGVKMAADLTLTRRGYQGTAKMAAGTVFRSDPVLSALGRFDPVRKSADNEYLRRVVASFPSRVRELDDPVMVARRGGESLSSADHSRGWRHPSRAFYAQAYGQWHRRIRAGQAKPLLDPDSGRMFPAPSSWNRWPGDLAEHPDASTYDLVLMADWSHPAARERHEPAVREALVTGGRVAVLHQESVTSMADRERPVAGFLHALIVEGRLDRLDLDDDISVRDLVVLAPEVLHLAPDVRSRWCPDVTHLLAPRSGGPEVDRRWVEQGATDVFRAPSRWRPVNQPLPSRTQVEPPALRTPPAIKGKRAVELDDASGGHSDLFEEPGHRLLRLPVRLPDDAEQKAEILLSVAEDQSVVSQQTLGRLHRALTGDEPSGRVGSGVASRDILSAVAEHVGGLLDAGGQALLTGLGHDVHMPSTMRDT